MKPHGIAKAAVSSKHLPNTNPALHRKALSQQAAAPLVCPQAAPGALRCAGPAQGGHAAAVPHLLAATRSTVCCWLFLSQKTCSTHGPERGPSCRKSHRFLRTKTQLSPTRTHFHMEGSLSAKHDKMQTPHLVKSEASPSVCSRSCFARGWQCQWKQEADTCVSRV